MLEEKLPSVTCVIPAYNEEKRLPKCLGSITGQDYPPDKVEILVVDDDSLDNTVSVAKSFGARVLNNGEHNIERGKSIGVQEAGGEYVLLMDADNALPKPGWLRETMLALLDNPEATGAQSSWFDYSREDPAANRYCSLFGINDPFAFYLKKRDKLTWYENDWVIAGKALKTTESCFLVRVNSSNMPTIGSQGYLIPTELVRSTDYVPYLFHMEMNLELMQRGKDTFVMLRNSVVHDHCQSVGEMLQKLKRNFRLFLEQREMRTYRWETSSCQKALALISMLTVVRPVLDSSRGFLAVRDPAWFLHPLICIAVPAMYSYIYLKWFLLNRAHG